ncbi:MAG: hypothetical protein WDZ77_02825 [Candidatus Pacearchaeota archaeon]
MNYSRIIDELIGKEKERYSNLARLLEDRQGAGILLAPLGKTAVHIKESQSEYNSLMRVYEIGRWKWLMGENPTEKNIWEIYAHKTGIEAGMHRFEGRGVEPGIFSFNDIDSFRKQSWNMISTDEFYEIQRINHIELKEINDFFERVLGKSPTIH